MTINLGSISFDEAILLRQLRQDMRDDWFPDALAFDDLLRPGSPRERIEANFDQNHGEYVPFDRDVFNVPKSNFTVRYGLETGVNDRLVYHGLAANISRFIDPLIPWYVFSHRRDRYRDDGRYLFRRSIGAWQDFVGAVRAQVTTGTVLLSTDLTNYFDNINISKLRVQLNSMIRSASCSPSQKGVMRSEVSLLFDLLSRWSFDSERGLPQNRDASSFLANTYMMPIDVFMRDRGYTYFRYMDDIKIVCASAFEARRALKDLVVALRDLGLAVNSKKTVICDSADTATLDECLDAGSPDIARLDALWATKSRTSVSSSFPLLRSVTSRLLTDSDGVGVDGREFRYCMNRMIMLATCTEFAVPAAYFSPVTSLVVSRLADRPAATDQFARYLRAVEIDAINEDALAGLLCDDRRSLYGWQNYRLWCLVAQKEVLRADLLARAHAVLAEKTDGPSRAGASLYLGVVGQEADRSAVAQRFSTLSSYLGQRSALISLQGFRYGPIMRENVTPYVRSDLVGVYRSLQRGPRVYFSPLERTSITKIVDSERDYA